MNLGETRDAFRGVLNRTDCTAADADRFLSLGFSLAQRRVRIPSMERLTTFTASVSTLSTLTVPGDYLDGIDLIPSATGLKPLEKVPYRSLVRKPNEVGYPQWYARFGGLIYLRGSVAVGSSIDLLYYGEFAQLASDADTNELLDVAPDVAIYAALIYAGDHYAHDRRAEWASAFAVMVDEVNEMAQREARTGGPMVVQPLYEDPGM